MGSVAFILGEYSCAPTWAPSRLSEVTFTITTLACPHTAYLEGKLSACMAMYMHACAWEAICVLMYRDTETRIPCV